ncbi:hypothetical protein D3C85_766380 [compost metagenome]
MQAAAGVGGSNRGDDLEQHRPGVQARFHLHHGDPGFGIAGLHRTLDRRGAAPARQQRGVAVDAAQARDVQHHLRQDQAVGHHHQQVGRQRGQFGLGCRIAQGRRLQHGNLVGDGELLDRAGHQLLAATGRAVGLGVHRHRVEAAVEQGLQVAGGKFRSTGEDDAQGLAHGARSRKKACRGQAFW